VRSKGCTAIDDKRPRDGDDNIPQLIMIWAIVKVVLFGVGVYLTAGLPDFNIPGLN